ncbi:MULTISPECIES: MFS transporter [unclassified Microbacterium]|uniref:MFS transporter n=1 Tax=Microbacterium sp. Se63.02b TaxID=2709304 RepID=UPI001FCEEB0E|nr:MULTISPECIES: MFS transporter [unclassified Microbacterium]
MGGVSASGAVLILFGAPWALSISAVLAVLSFTALTRLRAAEIPRFVRVPELGTGITAAARYAWRKPGIRWPLVLMVFVATFGMTQNVLFAAAARDVGFDTGPGGYSLYMAAGAFGALLGAVLSTRRRTVGVPVVVTGAVLFAAAMIGTAFARIDAVFVLSVVVLSLLRVMFATSAEALVQLSTNPAIRGRVSGLYLVIVAAGQTVGAVVVGGIVQTWGLSAGFLVAGGVPFVAGCVVVALTVRTWGLRGSGSACDVRGPRRRDDSRGR